MNGFTALSERVFNWAWTTSVHVTPLIVLVFLIQKLSGRRLTPGLRYALGCLVPVGLLLPVMPASPLSLGNLFPASSTVEKHVLVSIPVSISASVPVLAEGPPGLVRGTARFPAKGQVRATPRSLSAHEAASLVWLSGCLCLLVTAVWRHRRWQVSLKGAKSITEPGILGLLERAKISMQVQRPVALASMDRPSSPAIFGLCRVRLVLPEMVLRQLGPSELQLVFLHELAHVKRNDLLQNWLLMGVQFVHWFNPLVWVALHRLRADRELVCDAMVLQKLEPVERIGYGRVLLKLLESLSVERPPFSSAIPVVSSRSEIQTRMIMIKNHRESSGAARFATAALVTVLGCVTLTRAREDQPAPAKDPELSGQSFVPAKPAAAPERLRFWLEQYAMSGSAELERQAQTAIRQIGTNAIPIYLSMISTNAPHDSAEQYHQMARAGFSALGPAARPAVPALVDLLNNNDDVDVRSTTAFCLGAIGPMAHEAVPALTKCLRNVVNVNYSGIYKGYDFGYGGLGFLKERAATALGIMGPAAEPAIPILMLATNDKRWYVRNAARVALMRLRGESVLPLIEELKDTSDPISWYQRAMLVSDFGTNAEPAIPFLISALGTSNAIILGHAALALGKINREPSVCVPALIPLLSSADVSTRQKSLYALGQFGKASREAAPAITRCLGDSDPWVRMQATNILKGIDPTAAAKAGVR
ncbi:MAG: M56 family metallopeptidase [Verrucomicrobiota bacterium]